MENGSPTTTAVVVDDTAPIGSPPPPPDPNVHDEAAAQPIDPSLNEKSDVPLRLESETWDITSVSALGALKMLINALDQLASTTGDVPPTPPVSRPTTPRFGIAKHQRKASSTPSRTSSSQNLPKLEIGSPEAHPHEPITVNIGAHAEDITLQHAAIARRFFSKVAPPFTLHDYLTRFHHWCPHSSGVYLGAVAYIHQLCVSDLMVPATSRTIHRLALAAIRVSAKALEDNKWAQERIAKVGGLSNNQLMNLEVTLCFLLDFELFVDDKIMAKRMYLLQQAAKQGVGAQGRLSDQFKLKLPLRKKGPK
ncbi:Cyclin-U2-1 [Pseudocercospora fuligena]|uniref:Cyclin-U2-1 n=2 Tax=Pseudocercospora TaxID=131324 RepID=A0A8H6VNF6_9PEZI|nr:Cyclin-U2-1 [Pseudocercospora fuligena]